MPESREKTPERVDQRRQDGEHSRKRQDGRDDCIDYQGGQRVGTDGQEIRDDGRPLARATNEEAAGERDHRYKRFNDKLPVRQLWELAQATPRDRDGIRVAPGQALYPSSPCTTLAAPHQMSARRDDQRVRLQGMSEVSAI